MTSPRDGHRTPPLRTPSNQARRAGAGRIDTGPAPLSDFHRTILAALPRVRSLALSTLEGLQTQSTHVLEAPPSIAELRGLLSLRGGNVEVRLARMSSGEWTVAVGKAAEVAIRNNGKWLEQQALYDVDLHTHPSRGQVQAESMIPSFADADLAATNTLGRRQYILTESGVLAFRAPDRLPGGQATAHGAYSHWIRQDLKLSKPAYLRQGELQLMKRFFTTFYRLQVIPWSDRAAIQSALGAAPAAAPAAQR